MQNLLNPRWILFLNVVPLIILGSVLFTQYDLIEDLISPSDQEAWFFLVLAFLITLGFDLFYLIRYQTQQKKLNQVFAWLSLGIHLTFSYSFYFLAEDLIPFGVPDWMVSEDTSFFLGSLSLPALLHALLLLVVFYSPNPENKKAAWRFVFSLFLPVLVYTFGLLIVPIWNLLSIDGDIEIHVFILSIVVATLIFLFFIFQGLYILMIRKQGKWRSFELYWKVPLTIIFPLLGLALNSSPDLDFGIEPEYGVFGRFGSPVFFMITLVNGLLLCLPRPKNPSLHLALLLGRLAGLPFILYFVLVMLPFLPIAFLAVIAVGLGLLMLSPFFIAIIQIQSITDDFQILKSKFPLRKLGPLMLLAALILPLSINLSFILDRLSLHNAIEYVYHPKIGMDYEVNPKSLERALQAVEKNQGSNNFFFMNNHRPFLDGYYQWLVLDNLILSDKKIQELRHIFMNYPAPQIMRFDNGNRASVHIDSTWVETEYDKEIGAYRSWLHFDLKQESELRIIQDEFAASFALPQGCYISNYYLMIEDRKEMGLLSEKRSALWIYNNIRNIRRDPGLLHYLDGRRISFRVFPFAPLEKRRTGIEFVHHGPVNLSIQGHQISLSADADRDVGNDYYQYLSAERVSSLPKRLRKSYPHFLIDARDGNWSESLRKIEEIMEQHGMNAERAKISWVSSISQNFSWIKAQEVENLPPAETGFFLERAMENGLRAAMSSSSEFFPQFIILSNNLNPGHLPEHLTDWRFMYPGQEHFYHLKEDGKLWAYKWDFPRAEKPVLSHSIPSAIELRLFQHNNRDYYLDTAAGPRLITTKSVFRDFDSDMPLNAWEAGVAMELKEREFTIDPHQEEEEWLDLVKYSFRTGVMNRFTSYIALENDAQKKTLLKKQAEVLKGNPALDLDEESQRLSAPHEIWLVLVLLVFIGIHQRKRIQGLLVP